MSDKTIHCPVHGTYLTTTDENGCVKCAVEEAEIRTKSQRDNSDYLNRYRDRIMDQERDRKEYGDFERRDGTGHHHY